MAFSEGFTRMIAVSAAFDICAVSICYVSAIAVFGGAVSVSFPLCFDSSVILKQHNSNICKSFVDSFTKPQNSDLKACFQILAADKIKVYICDFFCLLWLFGLRYLNTRLCKSSKTGGEEVGHCLFNR